MERLLPLRRRLQEKVEVGRVHVAIGEHRAARRLREGSGDRGLPGAALAAGDRDPHRRLSPTMVMMGVMAMILVPEGVLLAGALTGSGLEAPGPPLLHGLGDRPGCPHVHHDPALFEHRHGPAAEAAAQHRVTAVVSDEVGWVALATHMERGVHDDVDRTGLAVHERVRAGPAEVFAHHVVQPGVSHSGDSDSRHLMLLFPILNVP